MPQAAETAPQSAKPSAIATFHRSDRRGTETSSRTATLLASGHSPFGRAEFFLVAGFTGADKDKGVATVKTYQLRCDKPISATRPKGLMTVKLLGGWQRLRLAESAS